MLSTNQIIKQASQQSITGTWNQKMLQPPTYLTYANIQIRQYWAPEENKFLPLGNIGGKEEAASNDVCCHEAMQPSTLPSVGNMFVVTNDQKDKLGQTDTVRLCESLLQLLDLLHTSDKERDALVNLEQAEAKEAEAKGTQGLSQN